MKKYIFMLSLLFSLVTISQATAVDANYVNCNSGLDSQAAGSEAMPWRTLQYALNNLNASRTVRISGTCNERLVLPSNITLERAYAHIPAVVDGGNVGIYPGVFEIWGQHDITISGLTIRNSSNIPGNTVKGIDILSGKGPDNLWSTADDVGSYNIKIKNNIFEEINRSSSTNAYALPLLVSSWGNSLTSGTAAHHISIVGNKFRESDTNSATLGQPLLAIVDNVTDFEIRNNHFRDADAGSAIEISGNRSTSAMPNRPHAGVIIGNTFDGMGESGIYITAAQKILIQRNTFKDSRRGVNVYTENQGLLGDFDIASDIWIRNNTFKDLEYQALATGAIWSSEYCDVANVYFTNNTVWNKNKPNSSEAISLFGDSAIDPGEATSCLTTCGTVQNECGGLIGDSKIVNNVIFSDTATHTNARLILSAVDFVAEPNISLDYNIWGAPSSSMPFVLGGTFKNFDGYKLSTGQDLHSIYKDFTSSMPVMWGLARPSAVYEPTPTWLNGSDFFGAFTPNALN